MRVQKIIEDKLRDAFNPDHLRVENESQLHAHHASSPGTGESHFRVHIVSDAFEGKSRLDRHRLVNDLLAEELSGPVHALAVHAKGPSEG